MDNDTLYDDSPVTKKFLEKCLQDHLHSKATLAKCRATVISKGMGFTSEVTRVWLRWSPEATATDINLPEKVIVKAPTIQCFDSLLDKAMTNDEQKSTMDSGSIVEMMHKIECDAYKILYRADPRPLPLPLIYSIREKNPSLIIMEDLEDRAGIIPTIAIGLNFAQWKSVTVHLARLHAWSLTTSVEWRTVIPSLESVMEKFKSMLEMNKSGLKVVKEKFKKQLGHIDESLYEKEICVENLVRNYDIYRRMMPDVMLHGDTWINNIMFLKDAKNPALLTEEVAAFFDWQLSVRGCGLNDLARLTLWCVPHELRRLHTNTILKIYFQEFQSKVQEPRILGLNFTLENVAKIFEHSSAIQCLLGLPMTDFILKFLGKVDQDETGWRRETLLQRFKALYDDCAAYFRSSQSREFLQL